MHYFQKYFYFFVKKRIIYVNRIIYRVLIYNQQWVDLTKIKVILKVEIRRELFKIEINMMMILCSIELVFSLLLFKSWRKRIIIIIKFKKLKNLSHCLDHKLRRKSKQFLKSICPRLLTLLFKKISITFTLWIKFHWKTLRMYLNLNYK